MPKLSKCSKIAPTKKLQKILQLKGNKFYNEVYIQPPKQKRKKKKKQKVVKKIITKSKKLNKYELYIHGTKWRKIREKVIERDGGKCKRCKCKKTLQVHHLVYDNLFNEEEHLDDLVTICKKCHFKLHSLYRIHDCSDKEKKALYGIKFKIDENQPLFNFNYLN